MSDNSFNIQKMGFESLPDYAVLNVNVALLYVGVRQIVAIQSNW